MRLKYADVFERPIKKSKSKHLAQAGFELQSCQLSEWRYRYDTVRQWWRASPSGHFPYNQHLTVGTSPCPLMARIIGQACSGTNPQTFEQSSLEEAVSALSIFYGAGFVMDDKRDSAWSPKSFACPATARQLLNPFSELQARAFRSSSQIKASRQRNGSLRRWDNPIPRVKIQFALKRV